MNIDIIEPAGRILLPQSSAKITSLYRTGKEKLYVGLSNGDIVVLRKTKNTDDEKSQFTTECTLKNICGKGLPIENIVLVCTHNEFKETLAIATSESIMIFEVAGSVTFNYELPQSNNSALIYIFLLSRKQYLVFTSKKRVAAFEIEHKYSSLSFKQSADLVFKEKAQVIRTLPSQRESSDSLIVGFENDFILLDANFQTRKLPIDEDSLISLTHSSSFSYFSLGSSEPSIWIIEVSKTKSLMIKDTQVMEIEVMDKDKVSVMQSKVKFSSVPLSVLFLPPLYLFVIYNKKIEVLDHETGDCIQRFQHQHNSNQLISHNNNSILITSTSAFNTIHQYRILNYKKQIEQFLSISGKGSSTGKVKDPKNDLKIMGLDKSISLVRSIDSSDPFFRGDHNHDISETLKKKQLFLRDLYRKKAIILFESYSKYHESLIEIASEWLLDYRVILSLFPDFLNGELRIIKHGENPIIENESISVRSFTHNVVKRVSLDDLIVTKMTSTDSGTDADGAESRISRQVSFNNNNSESSGADKSKVGFSKSQNVRRLLKAINHLIVYLTDQRRLHLAYMNDSNAVIKWKGVELSAYDIYPFLTIEGFKSQITHIASAIDTTLFLCYFYTKPMMLGPLLRLPNNQCNAEVVNECLLHRINSEHKNNVIQLHQQTIFIKELLDFYFGRGLHKSALEMLYKLSHNEEESKSSSADDSEFYDFVKGPDLTVQYLTKMSNDYLELVFEFSYWVIMEADNIEGSIFMAQQLFMNDSYECENYDNNQVLNFLQNVLKSNEMAIAYLEWLSTEADMVKKLSKNNSLNKFHTRLCLLYLNELKRIEKADPNQSDSEFFQQKYYISLLNFLKSRDSYEPWTLLKNIPTNRDRFLKFTVFIYRRLGEHEKSIDVLYNQLNNLDEAMEYCSEIHAHNPTGGENLLHKLLEDLLISWESNLSSIEQLLFVQGSKMSMTRVLNCLPDSFPLNRLSKFLLGNLRDGQERAHDGRIVSNLYQIGNLQLQGKIWDWQAKSYTINSGKQICPACKKRLGYGVFNVTPDDKILHYNCYHKVKNSK